MMVHQSQRGRAEWRIPSSWVWATLGEVFEVNYGKGLKESSRHGSGSIPVYGSNGVVGWHNAALVTGPCIVIGRKGTAGAVHLSRGDCWPIDTTYWTRPPAEVSIEYAYHLLGNLGLGLLDRSTAIPGLNREDLYSQAVPLAPFPEQRRIVAKIEELLSQLDAGVAALKGAQANLKRYKASVLQAACEGRLVPQGPNDEPAATLLERILAERRDKWEADLRAKGKDPKKAKYVEPKPPDADGLQELPEGWCWATIGQIGTVSGGLTKNPRRIRLPKRLPYLRVANVYADELRLNDVAEIGVEDREVERYSLESGDLLLVEGNGSLEQIGRAALWDGSIKPCLHQNHIIRVRLAHPSMGKFVLSWLLSEDGRKHVESVASSTSGLYTLSLSKVSSMACPLPPIMEQARIVRAIEGQHLLLEKVSQSVSPAITRAGRLGREILERAFEGDLVPQDPTDEPASVMLERIRAARQVSDPAGKRGNRSGVHKPSKRKSK